MGVLLWILKVQDIFCCAYVCCSPGLDEMKMTEEHVLYHVIHRSMSEFLGLYSLLVTSRPCPDINDVLEHVDVDRCVILSGFGEESREKFFSSYGASAYGREVWSGGLSARLELLLDRMSSRSVREMTFLPFIAALLVHSLPNIEIEILPKSAAHLTCFLISSLVQKRTATAKPSQSYCSIFPRLNEKFVHTLRKLASFAYSMTIKRQSVFSCSLLETNSFVGGSNHGEMRMLLDCLTFSFFGRSGEEIGQVEMKQFIHLSVQELLTAYHLVCLAMRDDELLFETALSDLLSETGFGSQFTEVLIFIAALIPPTSSIRFFCALTSQEKLKTTVNWHNIIRWQIWECFQQWHQSLVSDQSFDHLTVEKRVCRSLAKVFNGFLYCHAFEAFLSVQRFIECSSGQLTHISISCNEPDTSTLLSALCTSQLKLQYLNLELLNCSFVSDIDDWLVHVSSKVSTLVERSAYLHYLGFFFSTLSPRFSEYISEALCKNQSITSLSLPVPGHLDVLLAARMRELCQLRLQPIRCKDLAFLLAEIASNCNLTHLSVHILDGEAFDSKCFTPLLVKAIKSTPKLQSLELDGFRFDTHTTPFDEIVDLLKAVRQHDALSQFTLDRNLLRLGVSELVDALRVLVGKRDFDQTDITSNPVRQVRVNLDLRNSKDAVAQCVEWAKEEMPENTDCTIHLRSVLLGKGDSIPSIFDRFDMWYEMRPCTKTLQVVSEHDYSMLVTCTCCIADVISNYNTTRCFGCSNSVCFRSKF